MKLIKYLFVVFIVFYSGCSDLLVNEPAVNQNFQDYYSAYNIAKKYYPFFTFKKINWDSLYSKYKPAAEKAKGDEIYKVLYDIFRELKDGHIKILVEGEYKVSTYLPERYTERRTFEPLVVKKYLNEPLKLAGKDNISYGIFDNKTGYIYLSTFSDGDWVFDFGKVMENMITTNALIIDVRNNSGGYGKIMEYIISYFIENKIQYSFFDSKNNVVMHSIYPSNSTKYLKPVVILINGASMSCAELFPETMRQLKNVKLIGSTTGGAGGSYEVFPLPSGKELQIPTSYFARLDGTMVEWNGVVPDFYVQQTEADIHNQRDKQLEYAIDYLNNTIVK